MAQSITGRRIHARGIAPAAAKTPAVTRRESPGRKKPTKNPVSMNTMMQTRCGHWNERARTHRRKSPLTNTVTENGNIFSAFMPEEYRREDDGQICGDAGHRRASASQR